MNPERWQALMRACGFPRYEDTYRMLERAYGERHRHYHNAAHIAACLKLYDALHGLAEHPHDVELALWFHDAVYNTRAADNEERSAALANRFLTTAGAPAQRRARVAALIIATKHDAPAPDRDSQLVSDVDLSILGVTSEQYDAFEQSIRREYWWVPPHVFRRKRREILESLLQRERIYHCDQLHEVLEAPARANLARTVAALG